MKKLLFICLFSVVCSILAQIPVYSITTNSTVEDSDFDYSNSSRSTNEITIKDSIIFSEPKFSASLSVGKGIHDNDIRYTGAIKTSDSITHAFLGSDITYNIKVKSKDSNLIGGVINYGDSAVKTKVIGDSLLTATCRIEDKAGIYDSITVDAVFAYQIISIAQKGSNYSDTLEISRDTTITYQIPLDQTFVLYEIPDSIEFVEDTIRLSDIDSAKVDLLAKISGANLDSWEFEWIKDTTFVLDTTLIVGNDTITKVYLDSTIVVGNDSVYNEILKHDVLGDTMLSNDINFYLRYRNIAPDDSTVWFKDSIPAVCYRFYNSPKPAKSLVCIKNGNNAMYIAAGFSETNEELEEEHYLFVFDGNDTISARFLLNPSIEPNFVRTLWKYDEFDCFSEPTYFDESQTTEPIFDIGLTIKKGLNEEDNNYSGAVKSSDGVTHALTGSIVNYFISIDAKGGELVSGSVTYEDNKQIASVNKNFLSSSLNTKNETGVYDDITVNALLRFSIDQNLKIDFNTTFKLPKDKTFVLYPSPTYPKFVEGSINQFAYNSENQENQEVDVDLSVVPGKGGNNKWKYTWSTLSVSNIGTGEYLETINLDELAVFSYRKNYISEKIILKYEDIAPDGSSWISGTFEYPIRIYNSPITPSAFSPKGPSNTSNIYIATMPEKFGSYAIDNLLKEREYVFIYGNDNEVVMEKDATTDTKDCRWCNYTGHDHNNPWVETIWRYPAKDGFPAFECKSLRRYASDSRGEEPGTTGIDEIISDGTSAKLYTIEGKLISTTDTKSLPTGVYIIEKDIDGQVSRATIVVK